MYETPTLRMLGPAIPEEQFICTNVPGSRRLAGYLLMPGRFVCMNTLHMASARAVADRVQRTAAREQRNTFAPPKVRRQTKRGAR